MRVVLGAALAAVSMAAAASAQAPPPIVAQVVAPAPTQCADLPVMPAAPTMPDGASANAAAMEAYSTAYNIWAIELHAALECRRDEVNAYQASLTARTDEYNAGARVLNTANTTWEVEVNEFNARHQSRRPR